MNSKISREQKLLIFLAKQQNFVTADGIAEFLQISQKTVYRLIKKVNDDCLEGVLILSEKGRGYKLDYENYIQFSNSTKVQQHSCSTDERRMKIMEELLLSSPKFKRIHELYEEYFVSESVISTDETIIGKELSEYNLVLKRQNKKLAILGKELDIRKAILGRLQQMDIIDIDELKTNSEFKFNHYDVTFVLEQLRKIEKILGTIIPYPYNVNIFSHLYILISRHRSYRTSSKSEEIILTPDEQQELLDSTELNDITREIISNIESYLHEPLPEVERYFLFQYLISSRMEGNQYHVVNFSSKVTDITQLYIDEMAKRLHFPIKNEIIFDELACHIKPMINRLTHNIKVKNNLLEQIKINYEELFYKVSEVSQYICQQYQYPMLNEDENGFITLYFARMIEVNKMPIKTLIMCTTGIGTSELLKVKIGKKFSDIEIVDVISTRDIKVILQKYPDAELLLTTIHPKEEMQIPTLLISAMFTPDDQNRLKQKIEELHNEQYRVI